MLRETDHDAEERRNLTASERICKMKSVPARKQLVNFSLAMFEYCCSKTLKLLNVGEGFLIIIFIRFISINPFLEKINSREKIKTGLLQEIIHTKDFIYLFYLFIYTLFNVGKLQN